MRNSILGFSQRLSIEYDLTLNDLLLLQYIMYANGTPTMSHIVENEIAYVWISHAKIHEDLPILNISEQTLKNKLAQLKSNGFIISISIANKNARGSKSYYSITEKTLSLLDDNINECSSTAKSTSTRTAKSTSYNKLFDNELSTLSKDNVLSENSADNKTSSKTSHNHDDSDTKPKNTNVVATEQTFDFGKSEKPKPRYRKKADAYTEAMNYIEDYTNNDELKQALYRLLDTKREICRDDGYKFHSVTMKNYLEDLDKECKGDVNMMLNYIDISTRCNGSMKIYKDDRKLPRKDKQFKSNMSNYDLEHVDKSCKSGITY